MKVHALLTQLTHYRTVQAERPKTREESRRQRATLDEIESAVDSLHAELRGCFAVRPTAENAKPLARTETEKPVSAVASSPVPKSHALPGTPVPSKKTDKPASMPSRAQRRPDPKTVLVRPEGRIGPPGIVDVSEISILPPTEPVGGKSIEDFTKTLLLEPGLGGLDAKKETKDSTQAPRNELITSKEPQAAPEREVEVIPKDEQPVRMPGDISVTKAADEALQNSRESSWEQFLWCLIREDDLAGAFGFAAGSKPDLNPRRRYLRSSWQQFRDRDGFLRASGR